MGQAKNKGKTFEERQAFAIERNKIEQANKPVLITNEQQDRSFKRMRNVKTPGFQAIRLSDTLNLTEPVLTKMVHNLR